MKGSHKMHERFFAENGGIKASLGLNLVGRD